MKPTFFRTIGVFLLWLVTCSPLQAQSLVLIQGYASDGSDWHNSGITTVLYSAGWDNGGHLMATPQGVKALNTGPMRGNSAFYTVALPTEAPLHVQMGYLERYISTLASRAPNEPIYLAGHSIGGVLARMYVVKNSDSKVKGVLSIASPHLGAEVSELGLAVGQSPMSWALPMVGLDIINRSQGLYYDIAREHPGNALFWLNRQPHPEISYISIIRPEGNPILMQSGDYWVDSYSQDMNNVIALRGKAVVVPSLAQHELHLSDGPLLIRLLAERTPSSER